MKLNFEFEQEITKEFLLSKFSEETYMTHYLGIPVKKGLFRSPLRGDKTPTCSFFRNKSGELIFKDFSGAFYGNFVNVVMTKYECSYHKALKIIASDFGLIKTSVKKEEIKIKEVPKFVDSGQAIINVEIQDFTDTELKWWKKYGIDEKILKKFKVYSCKNVWLNGNRFASSSRTNMIFGYYGNIKDKVELWRIYFPKRKEYRFLSNWNANKIQGFDQLPKTGNTLVITKSMKDVMTLYSIGITAIAPNSENLFITDSVLEKLKERFTNIYVLYDNDLPGISNMNKIKKKHPELKYIWIPRESGAKDISDLRKLLGKEKFISYLKEKLLWLKSRWN
jgi:hypothetical protein